MRVTALFLSIALILFSANIQAFCEEGDEESLTIVYNGYTRISDHSTLINLTFIQPENGSTYSVFSDAEVVVRTTSGVHRCPLMIISNSSKEFTPYIIIHDFESEIVSIDFLGKIINDNNLYRILNVNTVIYRIKNENTYQGGIEISPTGYYTELFFDNKNDVIFNLTNKDNIDSFFRNSTAKKTASALGLLLLSAHFIYVFYIYHYRMNIILNKTREIYYLPDERYIWRVISLLNIEKNNIKFVVLFRKSFQDTFYEFEEKIMNSDRISDQARGQLLKVLYSYMLKPINTKGKDFLSV